MKLANLRKTLYYLKRNGLRATWYAARERMEQDGREPYRYEPPAPQELAGQREQLPPVTDVISLLVPAYRTGAVYLRELIASVLEQTYPHWELILADATEDDSVESVVGEYTDCRIRYVRLGSNGGISENTNRALELATGSYTGLLDHDDVLTPDALYLNALAIAEARRQGRYVGFLYSDEDKCNGDRSRYYEPHRKEDFNLDLLLSNHYICHFLVMESGLMKELRFRGEFDGAQDYDLVLRAVAKLMERDGQRPEEGILHIPRVLYHWRCHEGSTAENPRSKEYAYSAGRRALQDFADRQGWRAVARDTRHLGFYRLEYAEPFFASREDVGAVGGRVLGTLCAGERAGLADRIAGRRRRLIGGRYSPEGDVYYEGISAEYSGYMHRAVLQQDAAAVDLRCVRVRPECRELFARAVGVPYSETTGEKLFDVAALPEGADIRELGLKLGEALREAGYRILWDPALTRRL